MFKHSTTSEIDVHVNLVNEVKVRLREQDTPALPAPVIDGEVVERASGACGPPEERKPDAMPVPLESDMGGAVHRAASPTPKRNDFTTPMEPAYRDWVDDRLSYFGEK